VNDPDPTTMLDDEPVVADGARPRPGALFQQIHDGTEVIVYPMTFGKARVVVCDAGSDYVDRGWCFADPVAAVVAVDGWDGEGDPPGPWHRAVHDGRRREFDGNGQVVREWVAA
jgi:hypothetical protein